MWVCATGARHSKSLERRSQRTACSRGEAKIYTDVYISRENWIHIDFNDPAHPLLRIALDCLKDKEGQRPTAEQLCSRLAALKESPRYRDSLQPAKNRHSSSEWAADSNRRKAVRQCHQITPQPHTPTEVD